MASGLTMRHFLEVVRDHTHRTRDVLLAEGWHPSVIYEKAIRAARKDYIEYGVVADRPWLLPKGQAFLDGQHSEEADSDG